MPVKKITKKFNYSKKDLIELVLKIDDYKNFLPWCINSKILTIDKNEENLKITADLEIGFKNFREVYTSKVQVSLCVACLRECKYYLRGWK